MIRHYNILTQDISTHGLKAILEQILKRQQEQADTIKQLQAAVNECIEDGEYHIQKVGLHRFNPFSDTGGSQSFTIAILDKSNTGLVMTSLYARTGNRWYIKEVEKGKGRDLALSKEEQTAITQAQIALE